ncbi:tRNA(Ile)-lysidine synthetase [Stenotrophomonas daejeonensis]|uniref:tRNA(Ile)-lysidine synthase n=1 Tax=Stenotrophomonas daejeonensis TaxID=659018 RepID=A0A0R0DRP5_9GAMM|nr:tRNA lysidine(34) synthetase TilS [Stenotrophomonas daejeonensis]KRG80983.1 tRNA(Ile)-lysidine synthetase [Stenotrophomonas daejeonensis]
MTLHSPSLLDAAAGTPVLVGFSGGLDSTVLLHLLAHAPDRREAGLRAVHVHHGLQAGADDWAAHCQRICDEWQVPLHIIHVQVGDDTGLGPEAAARHARHAAFAELLQTGEWLALAHHRDDQAETFLLRALRGSGSDGLAAMRERRAFAAGQLWRPLLHVPRAALEVHARLHRLHWIEDPSNTRDAFDRNFLRNTVMPLLAGRWPDAAAMFARSAVLAGEASGLLHVHDAQALHACDGGDGTLSVTALRALPPPACARVLRLWVQQRGLPPLPGNGVARIRHDLLDAAHDRQAEFRWQQARIVRWRDCLHAIGELPHWPAGWQARWDGHAPLPLPDGGRLELHGAPAFDTPLQVRQREGGERIRLPGRGHSHLLKHCLQDAGVAPWLRPHLPLLCDAAQVLAAGDRIVSATLHGWLRERAAHLRWHAPAPAN